VDEEVLLLLWLYSLLSIVLLKELSWCVGAFVHSFLEQRLRFVFYPVKLERDGHIYTEMQIDR
jgi:hypothetical protein